MQQSPMKFRAALPPIQKILLMLGFMRDSVTRPAELAAFGQPRSNSQFTSRDSAKPERSKISVTFVMGIDQKVTEGIRGGGRIEHLFKTASNSPQNTRKASPRI
jgi:hypothetical protein